jgi:muramoyltetrapeptide carboxypeptidase
MRNDLGGYDRRALRPIFPPRLRPGDLLAVVAPASAPALPALRRGARELERRGYRVRLGRHVGERCDHLAGLDRHRLEDLHEAFADPDVRGILCARGGTGCTRLLDRVDYALVRRRPKVLAGFSDITALQLALLAKTGLLTFSGPMVATDWDGGLPPFSARHFWPLVELPGPPRFAFESLEGLSPGIAQGRLIAGTLSVLQTVIGTPYAPSFDGALLVLEDVNEEARRVDRALAQVVLAGIWGRVAGVVFATWSGCGPRGALERTLRHYAKKSGKPCAAGLRYGHVDRKVTLPQGVLARLDANEGRLELLEGAVS